jgi:uncharacterized protein DUF222/HNH endonuclease
MSGGGPVTELNQAIDGLLAVDTTTLSDDELGAALVELRHQRARLAAAEAGLSRAFELRRSWADDGSRSAGAWLKHQANTSKTDANVQFSFARRLARMPLVREALAAGEIDRSRAEILGRLVDSPHEAIAAAFTDSEDLLVGFAKDLEHRAFRAAVDYWCQRVDPDGTDADGEAQHRKRRVHMSQLLDGSWKIDGLLDPISGGIVHNELERLSEELYHQEWTELKNEHGEDAVKFLRPVWQRRADALVEMARRSAAMPPNAHPARPLITVLVGYETFAGRICELATGTVIAPGQAIRLLRDDPLIERIVFNPQRRIVDVSHRTRLYDGALRRAIQIRDRTCTHPGCDEPAETCDIDHVQPWSQGGDTTLDNGRLRCKFHHRWRHLVEQPALFTTTTTTGADPPDDP